MVFFTKNKTFSFFSYCRVNASKKKKLNYIIFINKFLLTFSIFLFKPLPLNIFIFPKTIKNTLFCNSVPIFCISLEITLFVS